MMRSKTRSLKKYLYCDKETAAFLREDIMDKIHGLLTIYNEECVVD
jgi:hypothetical protein